MKKWNNAVIEEIEISATAYGKNLHANEANANKHTNNGAGGRQPVVEQPSEDDFTKYPNDFSN